ncbi:prepilin-type N-terminal cleavage/methylation domain-containing protein [Roseimicrobium gellanilyticum]|uniref:Prepilin-type N-terminal cleavage/methylation domain-containing protein n=1 Tax=Roseimicrobium gellanilyticum TaxID=748857 RepID=A0A366H622_9BACT|nr:type II secretion system protein [Roseimicrobium gellanilyticum]RBP37382.1 prepilin-type N-terminal cleavage/methylation domain-containing protein [Roseimicrobium gellanilyticum]
MHACPCARRDRASVSGFTFVEALVTIAILGIMASILIGAFSSVSTDASRTIARQQQAAIQSALNAWVNGDSNRMVGTSTKPKTIEEIRTAYNAALTSKARLALISGYLDADTFTHINDSTLNSGKIKSDALNIIKSYIMLPDWTTTDGYPKVQLKTD